MEDNSIILRRNGGTYVTIEPDRALRKTRSRLPLIKAEHFHLVKYEELSTKDYIEDESKADTFKRVVMTTQAVWALAQVLAVGHSTLPFQSLN
jgi:hypothetical protein